MKTPKEKAYFLKPENLDIAALLTSNGIKVSRIMADKYHYLIDLLYLCRVIQKLNKTDYIPVNCDILEYFLTSKHAGLVKDNLVAAGVLETDGLYSRGKKSLGYRFAPEYRGKFCRVPVNQDSFAEKIVAVHTKRSAEAIKGNPVFSHIYAWLKQVEIDVVGARNFVESRYPLLSEGKTMKERKQYKNRFDERESRFRSIKRLAEADWSASSDKQGRFYTNYVQMARNVRSFCKLGGEDIYQADYSALQPSLLATLYPHDCPERNDFIRILETDGFYKYLADRYTSDQGESYDLDDKEQKKEFKKLVFSNFIYCENRVPSAMRNLFTYELPILAGLIINEKTEDYKSLPKKMQSLEARLVLSIVIPRLMEQFPAIPLLSVHDCVATTHNYLAVVKEAMGMAFLEFAGFGIGVKTEKVTW